MVKKRYIPTQGDIVRINFNPQKGHEQSRSRPALVLSPKNYNKLTGMVLVCPITSIKKEYPFEVLLKRQKTTGVVLADQIRSMDWKKRGVTFIEEAHKTTSTEIYEKISLLLSI